MFSKEIRLALTFSAFELLSLSCQRQTDQPPILPTPISTPELTPQPRPTLTPNPIPYNWQEGNLNTAQILAKLNAQYFNSSDPVLTLCQRLPKLDLSPKVLQFGWPTYGPVYGFFSSEHKGLDISPPYGAPVAAMEDGVIVGKFEVGWGFGNHLIIAHADNILTLYAHLAAMTDAPVGSWVEKNNLVGRVGESGLVTGPHLHFAVLKNCQFTNPLEVLPR